MMKKVSLRTVQRRFPDYVAASVQQPIMIVRDGEPVAVLVGLAAGPKQGRTTLREILERAWKEYQEHGGMSHEEFWDKLAKDLGRKKSGKKDAG